MAAAGPPYAAMVTGSEPSALILWATAVALQPSTENCVHCFCAWRAWKFSGAPRTKCMSTRERSVLPGRFARLVCWVLVSFVKAASLGARTVYW